MTVTIVLVYQSLLGIYGDRGNASVLAKRLTWRGIDSRVVIVEPGETLPADASIYLLGGGEDLAQTTAVRELTKDGNLFRALDAGAAVLAVCAGYQICGTTFTIGEHDDVVPGLGILDVETRRGDVRAVGEILYRWTKPDGTTSLVTGFENHGGFTRLGPDARTLGVVEKGIGNGYDRTEGAQQGTVVGTYPHGPVLARNPELADHVLELALGHSLDPLPRPAIDELRRQRIAAVRAS
jgi:CobQ-like glutamine amidotransferase family enzyme